MAERRHPRVMASFAVACNKGGVGKSTTLAQVSTQYAADHADVNVLVLDLTMTGNVSSLLFSSEGFPQVNSTASFLERLSQYSETMKGQKSWWPNRQWLRKESFDWADYVTKAQEVQPSSQPNLYVTRGGKDIRQSLTYGNWKDMVIAWCRSAYVEIVPDEERQWVVFFDTDQAVHTNHAQFALSCAEKVIVPLELDQLDFDRLLDKDDEEPGLFLMLKRLRDEATADSSLPEPARFHRLVFTKLQSKSKTPMVEPVQISFTPPQAEVDTIARLGSMLMQKKNCGEVCADLFSDPMVADCDFTGHYFTAIPKLPVTPLSISKMYALPFADLSTSEGGSGAMVRLPKGLPATRPEKEKGFTNEVVQEYKDMFRHLSVQVTAPA